ncbi:MAG: alkaline phosphatase family protein [Candidatus Bathyarchaeota archaeon]|nr:MAG: alkaline phosphatase family protein [Candidatus Bathyarchaeota archaeon]
MQVTVLGIDGLDHGLVEELGLNNLRQAAHGVLSIPDECYRELAEGGRSPWTPLCWLTILTGQVPPEEYRMARNIQFDNNLLEAIRWHLGRYLGFVKGKRKILWKLGFKPSRAKTSIKKDPIARTLPNIFDLIEEPIAFNVPTYSENWRINPMKKLMNRLELLPYADEEDRLMKAYVSSVLGRVVDYDLMMAYTRVLDNYGHQMYGSEQYIYRYRMMDLFVKEVSRKIDGLLLIVSDHGFRRLEGTEHGGEHSDHAFYSTNIAMDVPMNSLTDVYALVKRALET